MLHTYDGIAGIYLLHKIPHLTYPSEWDPGSSALDTHAQALQYITFWGFWSIFLLISLSVGKIVGCPAVPFCATTLILTSTNNKLTVDCGWFPLLSALISTMQTGVRREQSQSDPWVFLACCRSWGLHTICHRRSVLESNTIRRWIVQISIVWRAYPDQLPDSSSCGL